MGALTADPMTAGDVRAWRACAGFLAGIAEFPAYRGIRGEQAWRAYLNAAAGEELREAVRLAQHLRAAR